MVMSWFDDPFQYPDKLVDVTDLTLSLKLPPVEGYARRGGEIIANVLISYTDLGNFRKRISIRQSIACLRAQPHRWLHQRPT